MTKTTTRNPNQDAARSSPYTALNFDAQLRVSIMLGQQMGPQGGTNGATAKPCVCECVRTVRVLVCVCVRARGAEGGDSQSVFYGNMHCKITSF